MTADEAYQQATLQSLSDANGTRQDVIYLAMKIYAKQEAELAFIAGEHYQIQKQMNRSVGSASPITSPDKEAYLKKYNV